MEIVVRQGMAWTDLVNSKVPGVDGVGRGTWVQGQVARQRIGVLRCENQGLANLRSPILDTMVLSRENVLASL